MHTAVQPLPAQMLPQYPRPPLHVAASRHPPPAVLAPAPASARKRKRPTHYSVSYSEVKEVDQEGRTRDVIVIEDTPPPPTVSPATTRASLKFSTSYQPTQLSGPIRTRARAAAEAQALSASTSTSTIAVPPAKKRKRDALGDPSPASSNKAGPSSHQNGVSATQSWPSSSGQPLEDVSSITQSVVERR
jgi:dual-specificity kinase